MKKLTLLSICFTSVLSMVTSEAIAATFPHNSVEPLPAKVKHGWIKDYIPAVRFQGCEPYPAVGAKGYTNAGLDHSGSTRGSCSTTRFAQVYARSRCWNNNPKYGSGMVCGIMYAYYFPKDTGSFPHGHRHDWEDIIVFTRNGKVIGAAFSGHGDYRSLEKGDIFISGKRVQAVYKRDTTHIMESIKAGETENLKVVGKVLEWAAMSNTMRNALDNTDWGKANFPMGTKNYNTNMLDGWHPDWKNIH